MSLINLTIMIAFDITLLKASVEKNNITVNPVIGLVHDNIYLIISALKKKLLDNYLFFHRGPTFARSQRARCGSVGGIAGCQAAGGTKSGSYSRSE